MSNHIGRSIKEHPDIWFLTFTFLVCFIGITQAVMTEPKTPVCVVEATPIVE